MKAAPAGLVLRLASAMVCMPPLAPVAAAGTAYVTDELVLNVYSQENSAGQRLAALRSGALLETIAASGDSTQVRLPDGRLGWVKSSYLITHEPAVVRLKQLQDELDRGRSAPSVAEAGAAQAAARAEIERLTRELAAAKDRHDAPHAIAAAGGGPALAALPHMPAASPEAASESIVAADPVAAPVARTHGPVAALLHKSGSLIAAVGVAAGLGYWLGYASLARRVRAKFGGIKVY